MADWKNVHLAEKNKRIAELEAENARLTALVHQLGENAAKAAGEYAERVANFASVLANAYQVLTYVEAVEGDADTKAAYAEVRAEIDALDIKTAIRAARRSGRTGHRNQSKGRGMSKAMEAAARALANSVADEVGLPHTVKPLPGNYKDARACIAAYLAAREAEGWVMVPVEATTGMLEGFGIHRARMAENYRAMLAARPTEG